MSETERIHLKHDLDWFSQHNKPWDIKSIAPRNRITIGTQSFYVLDESIELNGYKVVYGYCNEKGNCAARMWYYSKSEAAWRAFNGYRESGGWQKGAEDFTESNGVTDGHEGGGYIYEAMVHKDLALYLEANWNAEHPVVDKKFIKPKIHPSFDLAKSRAVASLKDYYFGPNCDLSNIYSKERKYKFGNIPAISEKNRNILKTGSVDIQTGYDGQISGRRMGIGHILKKQETLWGWINSCITSQVVESVTQYHPILNVNYTTYTYLLKGFIKSDENCHIEIASTVNPIAHTYKSYVRNEHNQILNRMGTVETPIVWIKNAYYTNGEISSFGNYKKIPIHLAFIIQKPCDYKVQESLYYKNKLGYKDNSNQDNANITFNQGTYLNNALINEAVSPLVKKFKLAHQLPLFVNKYPKESPLAINGMKELIQNGVIQYELYMEAKERNSRGHHGPEGRNRALQLRESINSATTRNDIINILYRCFITNRVGTFTGGFFSKIQTNPDSLTTCVFRYVMGSYLIKTTLVSGWFIVGGPVSDGPNDCILRMKKYLDKSGPVPDADDADACDTFITQHSAGLLTAMRG